MPDPIRALLVDLSVWFGGATARALTLAAGMPAGSASLACLEGSPAHAEAVARGLAVHAVARSKADPRLAARLARIAREGEFRVLDTQNVQSQVWGRLAARRAGVALVSTLNSWYETEHLGSLRGRVYQAAQRWTFPATDLHVAVSREIRDRLLSAGVPADAVVLIPNAIRVEPRSVAGDEARLASRMGLPEGARVLCSVGRLVEAKGLDRLIEAVAAIDDPAVHALLVGTGSLRRALETLAARLGVARRVHFAGEVGHSETLAIVRSCEIFVMSSNTEGTPVALLEAAALGRPIVATKVGGIPDLVVDREHARLVEPGSPAALAASLRELLRDPAGAGEMGARAARHVAANFGVEAQVIATRSAYRLAWELAKRRLPSR